MRKARSLVWCGLVFAAVGCSDATRDHAGSPRTEELTDGSVAVSSRDGEAVSSPAAEEALPSVTAEPKSAPDAGAVKHDAPAESKLAGAPLPIAALARVSSCDEAAELIRARALQSMNAGIDANIKHDFTMRCLEGPIVDDAAASGGGARAKSTTNNQTAGVDEADFIKNDAKYVYAAMNGALRIVQAWPAEEAHEVANVELGAKPEKLFVQGDRALVYVSLPRVSLAAPAGGSTAGASFPPSFGDCTFGYDCSFGGDGTATALLVFDISDRAAPKQLRRIDLDGSLLAARRIGTAVHTVAVAPELSIDGVEWLITEDQGSGCAPEQDPDERAMKYEALRKKNTELIKNAVLENFLPSVSEQGVDYAQNNCEAVLRDSQATGAAFTTLVSVDMAADAEPVVTTILSKPGPVYASSEALYMAVLGDDGVSGDPMQRQLSSTIHAFRIGSDISTTSYLGSGKVKGHVLNQFSMDEHAGHLRVATSWGKAPSPDVYSTLSVLEQHDGKLNVVGTVDRFAPLEDIRSVRFDGDRAFIVTFKKTDPLYAFDLSDAAAPKITGALKIPGFSTYMHMLDPTHLLTIGYDAADRDDFAYFTGVLLQIFDVSDPERPRLAHKLAVGTRGSSSEALTNHLAFTLFEDKLAVPMTICEGGDRNGTFGTKMTFSGLMLFDVSVLRGIDERGRVAHPAVARPDGSVAPYDDSGCSNWWSRASSTVKRSVFMEDFVYSIAQDIMRVQDVDALGRDVAAVSLQD